MRNGRWRNGLVAALCAISFLGLCLRFPTGEARAASVLEGGFAWALALCGLWALYRALVSLGRPFHSPGLWALSVVLSGVLTLGASFAATGDASLLSRHPFIALGRFGGRVPLCFAAFRLLQAALCQFSAPMAAKKRPSLRLGGGLLLCWLPYLYFVFPGTVSNDSVTQVMQLIGVEPLTNGNPLFQTFLVYLAKSAGVAFHSPDAGVFLYCLAQTLLMAWLLGALLAQMAGSAAPRWLLYGSFGFFALCPVFPLFAFCMGKDTNFSMAVLWLSLCVLRQLRGEGSRRETLWLCLAAIGCALLRNPGVYLALLTLGVLWAHTRRAVPAIAMAAVLAVYGALHLLVLPGLSIAPMPETENWSLPLQQAARVAATQTLTPEEEAALNGVLDASKLKSDYNGELSDPVKFLWRESATAEQKSAFFQTWRSFLLKYPGVCLAATFHNTYGYLYPGYMSQIKPTLLIGAQKRLTPETEAAFGFTVNERSAALKAFTDGLATHPLYRALIAPGLYGWVCLFALATLLSSKRKRLLIAAVPALFSLAGCLLSAVNGYFRYAMPLYLCAPLLLWLCAICNTKEVRPNEATDRPALL